MDRIYYCDGCGFSLSASEIEDAKEAFANGPGVQYGPDIYANALESYLEDVRCEECKDLDRGELDPDKERGI